MHSNKVTRRSSILIMQMWRKGRNMHVQTRSLVNRLVIGRSNARQLVIISSKVEEIRAFEFHRDDRWVFIIRLHRSIDSGCTFLS